MAKKSIVWLASYPKSGNTWARIFLANYLLNRQTPMPINEIHRIGIGDAIAKTYAMVAGQRIDPRDVALSLKLRPKVLAGIVANDADLNLVKTHNIRSIARGVELVPRPLTRSAVYIVRDPHDVVLSYARHFGLTPEETVTRLGHKDNAVAGDANNVTQFLGSWSDHALSWTKSPGFPVLVLRYEDLHAAPEREFARLVEHLGMPVEDERLARAIRFSAFDEVSRQEATVPFIERSHTGERFFHTGTAGAGIAAISPALVERIRTDHGKVMKQFGYL
ncbi:MAG: sulfotransferase domain-containing protein [Paracoccaceae bacterium]